MELRKTKTERGFDAIEFSDCYGAKCSLQKSSLALQDAVWLGVDDAEPKVLALDARAHGVTTHATNGWVEYPIPDAVLLNTRMHLTREQVATLLPALQHFVDTGDLP